MLTRVFFLSRNLIIKLIVIFVPFALCACASTGTRVGARSAISDLGSPAMIPTSLGRLAVWDTGGPSAEPIVVLWPSIFSDHAIYSSLVTHWRGKRRIVLIDGPGHGASEGPQDKTYTMQACAIAMKEVLDSKSIQRAVVGGISWGGLVGGEFAIMYPQQTQGVIMMNTPFYTSPNGPSLAEQFITWGSRNILATDLFTNGVARAFFLPETREAGGPILSHFHTSLQQSNAKALSVAIRSVLIERVALVDRLAQISAPALIVAGLKDEMYPVELQREAQKKLKNGTLQTVDAAHISIVDQPRDVARILDDFLNGLRSN
jgi:3-oxoadipate enol-lactonase